MTIYNYTVVETIMDKGMAMRGTYEKFSVDKKARVAKHTEEYQWSLVFLPFKRFAIGQWIIFSKKEPFLLTG